MAEHMPTPWWVESSTGEMDAKAKFETGSKVLIFSDDCEHHPIADCSCNHSCRMPFEQEANAAFIVQAVNNHAALVEALHGLIIGATCEVNEKGAGGFMLARLSDAKKVLGEVAPDRLAALVGHVQVTGGENG